MSFALGQTPPVLFCVFNRLEYTKQAFAKIRQAKPKQFFVAADYHEAYCWGSNWMHNIIMNNGFYISSVRYIIISIIAWEALRFIIKLAL